MTSHNTSIDMETITGHSTGARINSSGINIVQNNPDHLQAQTTQTGTLIPQKNYSSGTSNMENSHEGCPMDEDTSHNSGFRVEQDPTKLFTDM